MVISGALAACLAGIACLIIILHLSKQRPMTKSSLYISILSISLSFGSFLAGFVIWVSVVKLESGDCSTHKFPSSSAQSVCEEEGVEYAIITIVILFVTVPFYFLISRKIYSVEAGESCGQPYGEQYGNRLI